MGTRDPGGRVEHWLAVIRTDYEQTPTLAVTLDEAEVRWGLERARLLPILEGLAAAGFLTRNDAGQFVRSSGG